MAKSELADYSKKQPDPGEAEQAEGDAGPPASPSPDAQSAEHADQQAEAAIIAAQPAPQTGAAARGRGRGKGPARRGRGGAQGHDPTGDKGRGRGRGRKKGGADAEIAAQSVDQMAQASEPEPLGTRRSSRFTNKETNYKAVEGGADAAVEGAEAEAADEPIVDEPPVDAIAPQASTEGEQPAADAEAAEAAPPGDGTALQEDDAAQPAQESVTAGSKRKADQITTAKQAEQHQADSGDTESKEIAVHRTGGKKAKKAVLEETSSDDDAGSEEDKSLAKMAASAAGRSGPGKGKRKAAAPPSGKGPAAKKGNTGSGRRRLQQSQSARQEAAPADVPQKAPHADPRAAARQQQQPPRRQQPPQQQPRQPEQGRAQPVMPQVMVENVDLTACALEMRAKAEQLHDLWNSHKQLAAQQAAIAEQVHAVLTQVQDVSEGITWETFKASDIGGSIMTVLRALKKHDTLFDSRVLGRTLKDGFSARLAAAPARPLQAAAPPHKTPKTPAKTPAQQQSPDDAPPRPSSARAEQELPAAAAAAAPAPAAPVAGSAQEAGGKVAGPRIGVEDDRKPKAAVVKSGRALPHAQPARSVLTGIDLPRSEPAKDNGKMPASGAAAQRLGNTKQLKDAGNQQAQKTASKEDTMRQHARMLLTGALSQPSEWTPEVAAHQIEETLYQLYADSVPPAQSVQPQKQAGKKLGVRYQRRVNRIWHWLTASSNGLLGLRKHVLTKQLTCKKLAIAKEEDLQQLLAGTEQARPGSEPAQQQQQIKAAAVQPGSTITAERQQNAPPAPPVNPPPQQLTALHMPAQQRMHQPGPGRQGLTQPLPAAPATTRPVLGPPGMTHYPVPVEQQLTQPVPAQQRVTHPGPAQQVLSPQLSHAAPTNLPAVTPQRPPPQQGQQLTHPQPPAAPPAPLPSHHPAVLPQQTPPAQPSRPGSTSASRQHDAAQGQKASSQLEQPSPHAQQASVQRSNGQERAAVGSEQQQAQKEPLRMMAEPDDATGREDNEPGPPGMEDD